MAARLPFHSPGLLSVLLKSPPSSSLCHFSLPHTTYSPLLLADHLLKPIVVNLWLRLWLLWLRRYQRRRIVHIDILVTLLVHFIPVALLIVLSYVDIACRNLLAVTGLPLLVQRIDLCCAPLADLLLYGHNVACDLDFRLVFDAGPVLVLKDLQQHDFDILDVGERLVREELADLACEPVALLRRVGAAPLVLYGDCERRPVEEAVPDSEVEFVLQFRWEMLVSSKYM
jgi:hypothetical protein